MTKILQVSDPHLMSKPSGRLKGVPTAETLKAVLKRARQECPNPDRIVLSGDLSHEHTVAGYELLRLLLQDWAERALLIPGNHDDRLAMRAVFEQVPGESENEVWFYDEVEDWLLLGLDTHVPNQVYGELSDEMLNRLAGWLDKQPTRPTLVFLHHPPVTVDSLWIDDLGLRNAATFAKLVGRYDQVRGIFCGHIHQVIEDRLGEAPVYSAPSTAFQFAPRTHEMEFHQIPPGFRVIELQQMTFSTRVVRLDEILFSPSLI